MTSAREQLASAAHGDEVGIAGAAADEDDAAGGGRATGPAGQRPVLQPQADGVAHRLRATRVSAGDRDGHGADGRDGGGAGVAGLVGSYRPHAATPGLVGDGAVHRGGVGGGVDEPGTGDVAVVEGPRAPRQHPGVGERADASGRRRGDHDDVGGGVDEGGDPPLGDRPGPHDEDLPARELEVEGVCHACSPHSFLAVPRQRPARGSSPSCTGWVHVAQPIEGKPW